MRPDVLGVIGLGAVGGSLAWQARRAGIDQVLGYGGRPADAAAAVRTGALTEAATSARTVFARADLVVLATSPLTTVATLRRYAPRLRMRGVWCTDLVGAKTPVAGVVSDSDLTSRFAGSHPQVDLSGEGFQDAHPARFAGATVYVTPFGACPDAAREVADFWSTVLDAHPVIIEARRHDDLLAWTSHLPRTVAAAFAAAAANSGPRGVTYEPVIGAMGTPLQRPRVWREVLLTNRVPILEALERYEDTLGELRRALSDGNAEALDAWLARAAQWQRRST